VLSGFDDFMGSGGVIQASPDNLTLYNSAIALRLRGGLSPHDEILGPDRRVISSFAFWNVQVLAGDGVWIPLQPRSSNFTLAGTNRTGTYLVRTMEVGGGSLSGVLRIVYEATSAGPLKWDLEFVSGYSSQYRLDYTWQDVTNKYALSLNSKQFEMSQGFLNYTFSWSDVPSSFNTTADVSPGRFVFLIGLGTIRPGSTVQVDPTLAINSLSTATAYTFQRRVFYDPVGGNYWVIYNDKGGLVSYRYSSNGNTWSNATGIPWGPSGSLPATSPAVFNLGQTVVVATGQEANGAYPNGTTVIAGQVIYDVGTISGKTISWQKPSGAVSTSDKCFSRTSSCSMDIGFFYVSVALSSNGNPTLSYAYRELTQTLSCNGQTGSDLWYGNSTLYLQYNAKLVTIGTNAQCGMNINALAASSAWFVPSVVVPADSKGGVRVVSAGYSLWFDGVNKGPLETLPTGCSAATLSVVSDADYGVHVDCLTGVSNGVMLYSYHSANGLSWTPASSVFSGPVSSPTVTVDDSTNDVYAFALNGSSVIMKRKTIADSWADHSATFPITNRKSPAYLGSNFASASESSSNQLLLVWTEGTGPYNATFASIPLQAGWSPYVAPSDPWDGYGLAPYGQYFSNQGEYVSPETGMLTIRQTDLTVPGRGMDLSITRVYTEPYSFASGKPYNYETHPWAPLGNNWQLNFPWMSNASTPVYVHLWNGEGYRIPYSFWSQSPTSFESHQGEHFRLVRNSTGVYLFDKSGVAYSFDPSHMNRLSRIIDPTGNNTIQFGYYPATNQISNITDTVGRVFQFCYAGSFLISVNQTSGRCGSVVGNRRGIVFRYSGQNLGSVFDPAGRVTSYLYLAPTDPNVGPWFPFTVTYPTKWYTTYSYVPITESPDSSLTLPPVHRYAVLTTTIPRGTVIRSRTRLSLNTTVHYS
jgi:hypothetical protein